MDTVCKRKLQVFGHVCRVPDNQLLDTDAGDGRTTTRMTHMKMDWQHSDVVQTYNTQ